MLKRLVNNAIGAMLDHYLKELLQDRIREGSIKLVKGYITAVKGVRLAALGIFVLGVAAAVLVTGLVLMIVGLVQLLPVGATTMAVTVLVIGFLLALVAGVGLGLLFSEKRWLRASRSYELMDAVLAPWPGVLPPNPVEIIWGHPQAHVEQVAPAPEQAKKTPAPPAEISSREFSVASQVASRDFDPRGLSPQISN